MKLDFTLSMAKKDQEIFRDPTPFSAATTVRLLGGPGTIVYDKL